MKKNEIFAAPKIELHVHLEGSLSPQFWQNHNAKVLEDIRIFQGSAKKSLPAFLCCFEKIHRSLQTPVDYYHAMVDLLDQLIAENIRYAEITWAPGGILEFHQVEPSVAFQAIRKAIWEKRHQIEAKILVDIIRNQPLEVANNIGNWLIQENPKEVIGINFGGDEQKFKVKPFIPLFHRLKMHGYKLTIHAGEAVGEEEFLSSIEEARPDRVGHGTCLKTEAGLLKLVEKKICVEACPSSNEILGYLPSREKHPVFQFLQLRASLNTDDRSFFSTTLTDEIEVLLNRGVPIKEVARMQTQAVEDSFSLKRTPKLQEIYDFWHAIFIEGKCHG